MNLPPAPSPEQLPVYSPERIAAAGGRMSFRDGLERLGEGGELKAKLLLVALTHFAARGYEGVQVKEVAEEAGVSKPTLYYHFGSKEGLFRQLCLVALSVTERRIQAMVAPLLDRPMESPQKVEGICRELAASYMGLLLELPEFTGFILRSIAVPSPDSGFRDLMPLVERALSPLGLFIHRIFGIPLDHARKEVVLFTGIMDLLLEERLRRPDFVIGEEEIQWAVDRWIRGLRG